ncbi:glycosyltransferase family 1 protein, partial [Streptomyces sp. SID2955]|nr:glycosyltransferase family 1 protein [Streptomyces sp. SID2955]
MNILVWHVHGSWLTAFVQGPHTYLVPVTEDRGPDGLGRAVTWDWPASVQERTPAQLRDCDIDLIVLQRPHELDLALRWTGRRPGVDVPVVYVEHNSPDASPERQRHPLAGQHGIPIVHVTHFNRLMWDNGRAPTEVVEHGIVDPGPLWTGTERRAAVVVNEPVRRGRTTGTDLLPRFARSAPLDVFGMRTEGLAAHLGLPPE